MKKIIYIILFFCLPVLMQGQENGTKNINKVAYDSLIVKADSLFFERDYFIASLGYALASEIDTSQSYPKNQMRIILSFYEKTKTYNKFTYRHVITDAENFYSDGDWKNAKKKYEEAFDMKPDCNNCRIKIKECDKKLYEGTPVSTPKQERK